MHGTDAVSAGGLQPPPLTVMAKAKIPVDDRLLDIVVFGAPGPDGRDVEELVALVNDSDARPGDVPIVRVHSMCLTGDAFGSLKCDCGPQLEASLAAIGAARYGILLYMLRHEGRGIGLADKIRAYDLQARGYDTVTANTALGLPVDGRDFGAAAAALHKLGVQRVDLLTNNPDKIQTLVDYGIEVRKRVPISGFCNPHNIGYLTTKDLDLGHLGCRERSDLPAPDRRADTIGSVRSTHNGSHSFVTGIREPGFAAGLARHADESVERKASARTARLNRHRPR